MGALRIVLKLRPWLNLIICKRAAVLWLGGYLLALTLFSARRAVGLIGWFITANGRHRVLGPPGQRVMFDVYMARWRHSFLRPTRTVARYLACVQSQTY